jgi:hypothetical protein
MVGTSASAPHVAGAAALLIQKARLAGLPSDPVTITQQLESMALDVGPVGPDNLTGYGKLRLDLTPPVVRAVWPTAGASVSGVIRPRIQVIEAGTLQGESMTLDGLPLPPGLVQPRIDTRLLPDGPHVLGVTATDMSGNVGTLQLPFVVDNTPPTVGTGSTTARSSSGAAAAGQITIHDADPGPGYVVVTRDRTGGVFPKTTREPLVFAGGVATVTLQGPGVFHLQAFDAAGNASRPLTVRLSAQ